MSNFKTFKNLVAAKFAELAKRPTMFTVNATGDEMWETYINSFPEGTNPIYKIRTEHDCSACRSFIKRAGNIVAIIDDDIVNIWDIDTDDSTYKVVADNMSKLIKSKRINGIFMTSDNTIGSGPNISLIDGNTVKWEHFFVNVPSFHLKSKGTIDTIRGEHNATYQVFNRGLKEITLDAIDTAAELISQNSIYRGAEYKSALSTFRALKIKYDSRKTEIDKENFIWGNLLSTHQSISRIRNSAFGTLLVDLSEGVDIEEAVKSYERIMAPENYKRPTALVTKKMVDNAKNKIQELGLTSALERRFANSADLNANDIIFINRNKTAPTETDLFDTIATTTKGKKSFDKVESISIADFIKNVVPTAKNIEVMVENKHESNLVSLIGPTDPTALPLFKWGNPYSWSYNGDLADSSIRARVKAAGGSIEGILCCRLAWDYASDLDLHMYEPNAYHISFMTRGTTSPCGGNLDVDANAGTIVPNPVENIYYSYRATPKNGDYKLVVENYYNRSDKTGFTVEIDIGGDVTTIEYPHKVTAPVHVATLNYNTATGFTIIKSLDSTKTSKTMWGIKTNQFVPVSCIINSPNYWGDNAVGNLHYFFMLEGCVNSDKARGFYNEFLRNDLNEHRKVMELVGSKVRTNPDNSQLSGIGFSSTRDSELVVKVEGAFSRLLKVKF
jgi:hypothetical protein